MKICFLIQTLDSTAGYGRYASDLINGLKSLGHEVTILKEFDDGYEGLPILSRGWRIFLSAFKIRRYVRDCDIVHAIDGYPYGIIATLACLGITNKLVISAQGTYAVAPLHRWKTATLLRWAYRRSARVISISRYTQKEILKCVSLENTLVINHGVDLGRFLREHQENNERFILSVGTVEDRKGYHISIPAFVRIADKFPDLKYYIIGRKESWYFDEIQNLIKDKRVADRIIFLSGISDDMLADLYRKTKLFVLASVTVDRYHFEGFGLVYLEAAAAGAPVIGTLGSGIEDAVNQDKNGVLVPQNDVDALAVAMDRILSDEAVSKSMSVESIKWAKEHSLHGVINKYVTIYKSI